MCIRMKFLPKKPAHSMEPVIVPCLHSAQQFCLSLKVTLCTFPIRVQLKTSLMAGRYFATPYLCSLSQCHTSATICRIDRVKFVGRHGSVHGCSIEFKHHLSLRTVIRFYSSSYNSPLGWGDTQLIFR